MKLQYIVVYEQAPNNYCAYLPDLLGCISTGKTWEDIQEMIREAATLHIEGMVGHGDPLPEKLMSLEEVMSYHSESLTESEKETLAEFGDFLPPLSTTFATIEVEVNLPAATGY